MELLYREIGQGNPLVMVHGLFGASDNLFTAAKIIAEDYKVILIDQRNHGQSPHSDVHDYSSMVDDLLDTIKKYGINKFSLLGHSMGGKTAMLFASRYPEYIDKLIVVDISPRFYKRHHDSILEGLNSLSLETLASRQSADEQLSKFIPEASTRQFLLKNLMREGEKFIWKINLKTLTEQIENIGEELDGQIKIDTPTLFIRGELSGYIGEKDEVLIQSQFPNSTIETIAGASHWVHAEKPLEFASSVKKFLHS